MSQGENVFTSFFFAKTLNRQYRQVYQARPVHLLTGSHYVYSEYHFIVDSVRFIGTYRHFYCLYIY